MKLAYPLVAGIGTAFVLGGFVLTYEAVPDKYQDIQSEQAKYAEEGYVQVIKGEYPESERRRLNAALPPNVSVNVYEAPEGKGYQIVTEYPDRTEYQGYGPQAERFTYVIATST